MENIDVKIEVKREKLLELNEEFFARVTKPIEVALMTSSVTMDEISEVILMGAGTRVPRVQVKQKYNNLRSEIVTKIATFKTRSKVFQAEHFS